MPRQVAPQEIVWSQDYVVCSHYGDTFNGPAGPFVFQDGLANSGGPISGALLARSSVLAVAHAWEYQAGARMVWDGGSWRCVAPPPAPTPVSSLRVAKPDDADQEPLSSGRRSKRRKSRKDDE